MHPKHQPRASRTHGESRPHAPVQPERYLLDTYALVCLVQDKPSYRRFADALILTTHYNLIELYYSILRDYDEPTARKVYEQFRVCLVEVPDSVIFAAMKLKLTWKRLYPKRRPSYVDCIGYAMAQSLGVPFVTGDREFEDIPHVEFVK